jgi:hypothetical protein
MLTMTFYQGRMVKADSSPDPKWVFIEWLYPGDQKFTAVKDVKRIEARIRQEGLRGWFAKSERDHTTMHAILQKMGAREYGHDEHNLHFMKEVK